MTTPKSKTADPLHGVTLELMLVTLSAAIGWEAMGRSIPIRCFTHEPSLASSLRFLRRTPWARAKLETLYMQRLPKPSNPTTTRRA